MKKLKPEWSDPPVYRTRPLPVGELRGSFLLAQSVITATREALTSFALSGIRDGGHEGMAFWAGRETDRATCILQAIVPNANHSSQRVMASAEAVGSAARAARKNGLGILCQVHSHPGSDARHSDGDDDLVLLPFERMLSVVVPGFGLYFSNLDGACVHQFQDGKWVLCSAKSVTANMIVVPSCVDLRG
jgi:proteasome lid subunit RPN8/RPN11